MRKFKYIYIDGIKSKYVVNNYGEVYRIKSSGKLKIMKQQTDADGYFTVGLHLNGVGYFRRVNRLVAQAFIDNPQNKPEVNHIDGDKQNNIVENLEWVTSKENIDHAWKNNLTHPKSGDKHPNSKYTEKDIRKVCKYLVQNKYTMKEISKKTGVSYTVVKQVRNHIIWTKVSSEFDFSHYNQRSKNVNNTE
jgi:hypothetical protein